MNLFLTILLGLFVLAGLALGSLIVRRPLIGRIAVREAARRPGQTAVLVAGLMIAGAAIFAIQVIFDSMYETNRAAVLQNWGRNDIEISGGGAYFDPGIAQQLAAGSSSCSCIAAVRNSIVTTGSVVDLSRGQGKPNVQITGIDLTAQQRFGSFVLTSGQSTLGAELAAGGVFLSQPLADAIGARVGDRLHLIAGSSGMDVTVAGIMQRDATSANQSTATSAGAYGNDRAIVASLATVQQLANTDRVNLIQVSARGDGDAEVASGRAAAPVLRGLLTSAAPTLQLLEVKRAALDQVLKESEDGRPFVSAFGVIIALAATGLVANLAVMLSEERRPRLAVLRALGLTRTGLVELAVTEGAIYSLLGAIAGVPAGLALAAVVVHGPGGPPLMFAVHPESLLGSVAAAALINVTIVLIASLRTTGMAISSAIRDLPDRAVTKRTSKKRLAMLALLGLAGLGAAASGSPPYLLLGGALLIAAAAGFSRGRVADRVRYSAAGAVAAAWAIADYHYTTPRVSSGDQTGLFIFTFLVSVLALSVFVAANLRVLEVAVGWFDRLSGGLRIALRPSMAYAVRRPLRSGLVIATFSVITAMLVLVQALSSAAAINYAVVSGGWDVQATVAGTDQLSVPASLQPEVARQEVFPSRTFLGPVKWVYSNFQGTLDWHQEAVTVFGLSQQQLASGVGFGSRADWAAIGRNPNLVAATEPVGSVIYLGTANGVVKFTVAVAIPAVAGTGASSSIVPGLMASQQSMDQLAGSAPGALLLLNTSPGTTPATLARDLQQATLAQGADVSTTKQLVANDNLTASGLTSFLLLLMRIGLIVGVASLGAVALRAVIERRRSIGMLRAVGYQPAQILIGMLAETVAVATAGLAVGLAVAYAMGSTALSGISTGAAFNPDLGSLGVTIGIVYVAVLLVTLLPALQAARLRPAEALRVLG
jgi:putative ABC transport system permease protein